MRHRRFRDTGAAIAADRHWRPDTRPDRPTNRYIMILLWFIFPEDPNFRGVRAEQEEEERLKSISGQIVIFSVVLAAAVGPARRNGREKNPKEKKPKTRAPRIFS